MSVPRNVIPAPANPAGPPAAANLFFYASYQSAASGSRPLVAKILKEVGGKTQAIRRACWGFVVPALAGNNRINAVLQAHSLV